MLVTFDIVTKIVVEVADATALCPAILESKLKGIVLNLPVWNGSPMSASSVVGTDASMTVMSCYAPDVPTFVSAV